MDMRQMQILRAFVIREAELRAEDRSTEFMLLRRAGGGVGLKPGIPNEPKLKIREGDVWELVDAGHLREIPSDGNVILKFGLTSQARQVGAGGSVTSDPTRPRPTTPPPSSDDVLAWVVDASQTPEGARSLERGGSFMNDALAMWGTEHLPRIASHLIDLEQDGQVRFDDPAADLDQLPDADRLGMAGELRPTSAGRDRIARQRAEPLSAGPPTQLVFAHTAQVAAGDINSDFRSYDELLDVLLELVTTMGDVSDGERAEAVGLVQRLRGTAASVATGTATSAAGAIVGAALKAVLGLH